MASVFPEKSIYVLINERWKPRVSQKKNTHKKLKQYNYLNRQCNKRHFRNNTYK